LVEEKHGLIGFYDLKEKVIDPGFCTFCAACEAACPVHAIKVEGNKLHYTECSDFLDVCSLCYNICPHTESLLFEAMSFVEDAPRRREPIGNYIKIVLAQSVDPKIRNASHSGGVVAALLTYALNNDFIDSAVVSERERQVSLRLKPSICLVPDNCFSAVDSIFSPSTIVQAYGDAVHGHGKAKIAFVGLPHQILAIRKLEAWEHKIMKSLRLIIGLFCLWNFSLDSLLEYLNRKFHIKTHEIEKLDLTETYNVHTRQRVVRIPIQEILPHVLKACRVCTDFTAELADVSVGGATPLKGWSTVIIRTRRGEKLFGDAVKNGVIRIMEIEKAPEALKHLMVMAEHKREIAIREARKRKKLNKPVPPIMDRLLLRLPLETSLLTGTLVEDVMTTEVVTVKPKSTIDH